MSRLIDADELKIDYGFTWDDITPTHEELYELIDRQPTIERKKGKWLFPYGDKKYKRCSVCERDYYSIPHNSNFCPNCGSYNGGENEV